MCSVVLFECVRVGAVLISIDIFPRICRRPIQNLGGATERKFKTSQFEINFVVWLEKKRRLCIWHDCNLQLFCVSSSILLKFIIRIKIDRIQLLILRFCVFRCMDFAAGELIGINSQVLCFPLCGFCSRRANMDKFSGFVFFVVWILQPAS